MTDLFTNTNGTFRAAHAPIRSVYGAQVREAMVSARLDDCTQSDFSGSTFDPALDRTRITRLLDRVAALMADGKWRTLAEIVRECGGSEASCSARLRDLRKEKCGAHTVLRRRRGAPEAGLWEYSISNGKDRI